MSIRIIAAMSNNWVIGSEGTIPWACEADRDYFKACTEGHDLIVGRKTWENCWHLPHLIVLSKTLEVKQPRRSDTKIVRTIDEALATCGSDRMPPTYVIGGEQIYKLFLPLAQRLLLSQIDVTVAGDAFFPDFGRRQWEQTSVWREGICRFFVYEKERNARL